MTGQPGQERAHRRPSVFHRRGVVPSFTEGVFEIADGRTLESYLDVVPWRPLTVPFVEILGLRIAPMLGVVTASVTQVDATDECNVARRVTRMADEHELLVVRTGSAHALVEKDLSSVVVDPLRQLDVMFKVEAGELRV